MPNSRKIVPRSLYRPVTEPSPGMAGDVTGASLMPRSRLHDIPAETALGGGKSKCLARHHPPLVALFRGREVKTNDPTTYHEAEAGPA